MMVPCGHGGANFYGQLGNETYTDNSIPHMVQGLSNIMNILGTENNTIAVKNDGTVWVWGRFSEGFAGKEFNLPVHGKEFNLPVQMKELTGIVAMAEGNHETLALKNDG